MLDYSVWLVDILTSCLVTPIRLIAFTHKIRSPVIFVIINDLYSLHFQRFCEVFGQMTLKQLHLSSLKRLFVTQTNEFSEKRRKKLCLLHQITALLKVYLCAFIRLMLGKKCTQKLTDIVSILREEYYCLPTDVLPSAAAAPFGLIVLTYIPPSSTPP